MSVTVWLVLVTAEGTERLAAEAMVKKGVAVATSPEVTTPLYR
jgi:hypothetical protein